MDEVKECVKCGGQGLVGVGPETCAECSGTGKIAVMPENPPTPAVPLADESIPAEPTAEVPPTDEVPAE